MVTLRTILPSSKNGILQFWRPQSGNWNQGLDKHIAKTAKHQFSLYTEKVFSGWPFLKTGSAWDFFFQQRSQKSETGRAEGAALRPLRIWIMWARARICGQLQKCIFWTKRKRQCEQSCKSAFVHNCKRAFVHSCKRAFGQNCKSAFLAQTKTAM